MEEGLSNPSVMNGTGSEGDFRYCCAQTKSFSERKNSQSSTRLQVKLPCAKHLFFKSQHKKQCDHCRSNRLFADKEAFAIPKSSKSSSKWKDMKISNLYQLFSTDRLLLEAKRPTLVNRDRQHCCADYRTTNNLTHPSVSDLLGIKPSCNIVNNSSDNCNRPYRQQSAESQKIVSNLFTRVERYELNSDATITPLHMK
ncbi:hypothetical protein CLF_111881 [Clonorchis sinensis]|uniref:Uncharacterized protein n=1 Tax=Clonorchis sinensis TaxID=79923 RepID=G7YVH4_CLOSI|nr:hypothetical protein CLF_111881 [Clonorchis sinensis]